MKGLLRRTVDGVSQRTPESVRRLLRPGIKPIIDRIVGGAPSAPPPESTYRVTPLRPVATSGPRVLHVIGNFFTGGSSRLVVDIYERLGHRFVQHVVTQMVSVPAAYEGLPVTMIHDRDSGEPILAVMREFLPDFVHVHYWGDCDEPWYRQAFLAAERLGIPVIENVNTPVTPYASPAVREYIYVSDYVREAFPAAGVSARTVYPGSDFSHFRRSRWRPSAGTKVGMVYRLEPDKLDERAIQPLMEAARRAAGARCLVVGGGTFLESYETQVREAGLEARFDFTGYVPYATLPGLYREMAIFVAPVWKESFGQVSPFAMSMGIPVVGYDVGAIGEIIDDRTLLAPPGDAPALGRIIADLLADPVRRHRIGRRNRERARRLFSVEAMIESYETVYSSLVGEPA